MTLPWPFSAPEDFLALPFYIMDVNRTSSVLETIALTWYWGTQPPNRRRKETLQCVSPKLSSFWGWEVQQSSQKTTEPEAAFCRWVGSTLYHIQNCNVPTWAMVLRSQNCASSCPLICKKCQAGHSGRKSRHRIWFLFPRRQWSGLSQTSSSTQRVNQDHPLDSQCPSGGQKLFPISPHLYWGCVLI